MVNRDQDRTEPNKSNMSKNTQVNQPSGFQGQKSGSRDDSIGNRSSQGVDPKIAQKNQNRDVNQKPQADKGNFNQGSGMTSKEKRT